MNTRTLAVAALLAAAGAASAQVATTPQLIWQQTYSGTAGNFAWAHHLTLDSADSDLYVVGKSSENFTSGAQSVSMSVIWVQGFGAANGQQAWATSLSTGLLSGYGANPLVQEEMGASVERWPGSNLLLAGRFPGTAGSRLWTGHRRNFGPTGTVLSVTNVNGSARSSGFSPATRGVSVGLVPTASTSTDTGWSMQLQPSVEAESAGYNALDYGFTEYNVTTKLATSYDFVPLLLNSNYVGDCCYDPPKRMAIDTTGTMRSLAGSFYDASTGSFGFMGVKVTASGAQSVWTYEGTAPNGRSFADELVGTSDGTHVFVVAKTSETGRGFATRLLGFDGSGNLQFENDLATTAGPMRDAVLALSPSGLVWVIESKTGFALLYDLAGNQQGGLFQLPFAPGSTYYVGDAVADANGNLFVSGTLNGQAWVADYNNLVQPATPSCDILTAFNYPNPFDSRSGQTTIQYSLFSPSDGSLTIYDQLGAKVNSWGFSAGGNGGAAGANQLTWDGSSSGGQKVLRGMYTAVLKVSTNPCTTVFRIGVIH